MKRLTRIVLIIFIIITLSACGRNGQVSEALDTQKVEGFAVAEQLPSVSLSSDGYAAFLDYLDYDNINCPYSELFGIKEALEEKAGRNFDAREHTYDFFAGSSYVDANKLFDVVKANNKQYAEGVGKHFNKELSDSKLKECCEIVADTLNWGIENIDGIELEELGCILGNLKILNRGSVSFGTFNDKNDLLNISPDMIKQAKKLNGNSDMYEITVSHEAMHILQCRCTDIEQGDEDSFIGTSYSFENLEVNPLKNSWLYEASAELNATLRFNCNPTTYQYMIDNLESISLATVLNDNVEARQLEKLCFTRDDEALYSQLEFADKTKAIEFLYVVELLRNRPEDFKLAYEKEHGPLEEDYSEFLKKTYNPYFAEVISKLLYKNLALKLSQNEMSLNDVFYIISMYELDLSKDIPLNNASVREKYKDVYDRYADMQRAFFALIQAYTDINVEDSFNNYRMNYEGDAVYANASLDWLEAEKRAYILFRNNVMYNKNHKHIVGE